MMIFVQEKGQRLSELNIFQKAALFFTKNEEKDSDLLAKGLIPHQEQRGFLNELCGLTHKKKNESKPLIDLVQANQMAKSSEDGFSTFMPTIRCCKAGPSTQDNSKTQMKTRKRLLKERYFKILQNQQKQDDYQRTIAKKKNYINNQGVGKIKVFKGFPSCLKPRDTPVFLAEKKEKQFNYLLKHRLKDNPYLIEAKRQSQIEDNYLRKKALAKINNFQCQASPSSSQTPIFSNFDSTEKLENLQNVQSIKKPDVEPTQQMKKDCQKQRLKSNPNQVANPFLSTGYNKLNLSKIIQGNFLAQPISEPISLENRSPTYESNSQTHQMTNNRFSSIDQPDSKHMSVNMSIPNIVFSKPNHSNSNFQFTFNNNNNTSGPTNFSFPQYEAPMSFTNQIDEKKNALSMFFSKSIEDTPSLFAASEKTNKKCRPARQKGKEKTRIS